MYWPDLRLPPINLWNLPYMGRYEISSGGVAHKRSSEYLKSPSVQRQLKYLEENWNKVKGDK